MDKLSTKVLPLSTDERKRLLAYWEAMEDALPTVRRLTSLTSELRMHSDASGINTMILFYRGISEVSYGHSGSRGGIRRAYNGQYSELVKQNMVMCFGGYYFFAQDSKALIDYIEKQVKGEAALKIVRRIKVTLAENDAHLKEAEKKLIEFFGVKEYQKIQMDNMDSMMLIR